MSALPPKADIVQRGRNVRFVPIADISAFTRLRHFVRSVLLDPLVPDLRRRATSSRCRGARAGDCRDLLQQCFLRLRQIERITVGLMISGASVPVDLSGHFGIHSITPFRRSVLLDPLVPDLRRRATSSRCRGARAGDFRDLLQQRFLRLRQIERITVGLMISGASVPVDLDQIFFQISEIKGE